MTDSVDLEWLCYSDREVTWPGQDLEEHLPSPIQNITSYPNHMLVDTGFPKSPPNIYVRWAKVWPVTPF